MFVMPTTEKELLNIVSKFNNKTSEDVNGLSMKVLKLVIGSIVKPLTFVTSLSFSSGIFPNDLKIANCYTAV